MIERVAAILVVCVVSAVVLGCSAGPTLADPCFKNLPSGWTVEKSDVIDSGQTSEISQKLGVPIKRLSNTYLAVDGTRIQVNILEANTPEDASRVYEAVAKMKGEPAACKRKDLKVFEYVGDSTVTAELMNKVSKQLGL